jgi:outer membrane protein assembly factor BamB
MSNSFSMKLVLAMLLGNLSCSPAEETPKPSTAEPIEVAQGDWPWWRGPDRNGIADPDQSPPTAWSETENVLWKTNIPGRGHSAPIVAGERVYLTTADEDQGLQLVICLSKDTGKEVWKTVVHEGGLMTGDGNKKTSQASPSVACDGKRIFANFLNNGAVHTTALDLEGEKLWQTKITNYKVHQGYGSSPAVYGSLVIVSADNKGGGAIVGLDRATGDIVWKHDRPATPNYASPVIVKASGKEQLIFTGCDLVSSYDPSTGKKNWEIKGATTECVTSTVTDGEHVFTSGGYPDNHVSAVKADGTGEVAWRNNVRVYVPSMLLRDGNLYAVTDNGVLTAWKAASGEELWKHRLGGTFTASPVLVGDLIYATNEAGTTYVVKIDESGAETIAENQLGDDAVYSTPTITGSRIYMRVGKQTDGKRQEILYCLGKK